MDYLHIEHIQKILSGNPAWAPLPKYFYESGTNVGQTIFHLAPYFETLWTSEILKDLHDAAQERAKKGNIKNIIFSNMDTLDCLPAVCELNKNARMVFWLDGHYFKYGKGRGKVDPPMKDELSIILDIHAAQSIVIIDNMGVSGRKSDIPGGEDWTHVSPEWIVDSGNPKIKKYYIDSDRLIILIE